MRGPSVVRLCTLALLVGLMSAANVATEKTPKPNTMWRAQGAIPFPRAAASPSAGEGGGGGGGGRDPVPQWPAKFRARFRSYWKRTQGWYSVDVSPGGAASQRIDLQDGTHDHLCSVFHKDTACTQLTTKGFRYLHFPEVGDCCKCCSYAAKGYLCGGPLMPKWLSNATGNLLYEGLEEVDGRQCDRWRVQGLSWNLYLQFAESGLPCEVDAFNYLRTPEEHADDQYIFDPLSYTTEVPGGLFEVPPECRASRFCGAPVCDTGEGAFALPSETAPLGRHTERPPSKSSTQPLSNT